MSEVKSEAVTLPPGSYDYDKLKSGLGQASRASRENRPGLVEAAVSDAREGDVHQGDQRNIPGYEFVNVENTDLGITERVQVWREGAETVDSPEGGVLTIPADTAAANAKE